MHSRGEQRKAATDIRNGVCQSAFCAAGHAAFESGHRLIFSAGVGYVGDDSKAGATAINCIAERPVRDENGDLVIDAKGRTLWEDVPGAEPRIISNVGADYYGLDRDEAEAFFHGENDLDDLKQLTNGFCEARKMDHVYPDHDAIDAFIHLVNHGERYPDDDE